MVILPSNVLIKKIINWTTYHCLIRYWVDNGGLNFKVYRTAYPMKVQDEGLNDVHLMVSCWFFHPFKWADDLTDMLGIARNYSSQLANTDCSDLELKTCTWASQHRWFQKSSQEICCFAHEEDGWNGWKRPRQETSGIPGSFLIPVCQWEFQDPKLEVLYHIRLKFWGVSPYIALT